MRLKSNDLFHSRYAFRPCQCSVDLNGYRPVTFNELVEKRKNVCRAGILPGMAAGPAAGGNFELHLRTHGAGGYSDVAGIPRSSGRTGQSHAEIPSPFEWLMKILSHDIAGKRFLEMIEKFLKAGRKARGERKYNGLLRTFPLLEPRIKVEYENIE